MSQPMSCARQAEILVLWDGGADAPRAQAAREHLEGCPICRRTWQELRLLSRALAESGRAVRLPEARRPALRARVLAACTPDGLTAGKEAPVDAHPFFRRPGMPAGTSLRRYAPGLIAAVLLGGAAGLWVTRSRTLPGPVSVPPARTDRPRAAIQDVPPGTPQKGPLLWSYRKPLRLKLGPVRVEIAGLWVRGLGSYGVWRPRLPRQRYTLLVQGRVFAPSGTVGRLHISVPYASQATDDTPAWSRADIDWQDTLWMARRSLEPAPPGTSGEQRRQMELVLRRVDRQASQPSFHRGLPASDLTVEGGRMDLHIEAYVAPTSQFRRVALSPNAEGRALVEGSVSTQAGVRRWRVRLTRFQPLTPDQLRVLSTGAERLPLKPIARVEVEEETPGSDRVRSVVRFHQEWLPVQFSYPGPLAAAGPGWQTSFYDLAPAREARGAPRVISIPQRLPGQGRRTPRPVPPPDKPSAAPSEEDRRRLAETLSRVSLDYLPAGAFQHHSTVIPSLSLVRLAPAQGTLPLRTDGRR